MSLLSSLPEVREMSVLNSPRESNSPQKMYKTINLVKDRTSNLSQMVNNADRDSNHIQTKRNQSDFDFFPFKVYTLSDDFRPLGFVDNWHTVRVRGGYVMTDFVQTGSYVQGCDGFQDYADSNYITTLNSSNQIATASYDIMVPSASYGPMWFWIECDIASAPVTYNLRYAVDPTSGSSGNPNPWATFPSASANYIPIAVCDAYTSASQYTLLIRQILRNDYLGAGTVTVANNSNNERGLWSATPSQPYNILDKVLTPGGYWLNLVQGNTTYPDSGIGWQGIGVYYFM